MTSLLAFGTRAAASYVRARRPSLLLLSAPHVFFPHPWYRRLSVWSCHYAWRLVRGFPAADVGTLRGLRLASVGPRVDGYSGRAVKASSGRRGSTGSADRPTGSGWSTLRSKLCRRSGQIG